MKNCSCKVTPFGSRFVGLKRYLLVFAAAWTSVIGISLVWNGTQERNAARHAASVAARAQFAKDVLYRRWNAQHGGVYVPISESTPPNPYLKNVEEREIETPSGRQLTLINPAYMTRQVHELGFELGGVRGHITSLQPIRPANAPDAWEKRALESFERGEREFVSVETFGGDAHLRLMRPLITEKGCLKCHAEQGYKEGDVRGGISVSMPMAPYSAIALQQTIMIAIGHGALWLLGLAGLVFGARRIDWHVAERGRAETSLRESEDRFRGIFEHTNSGVAVYQAVDDGEDFVFVDFNARGEQIENISRENVIGKRVTEVFPGVEKFGLLDVFRRVWRTGEPEHHPITMYRDDRIQGWRENYVYRLRNGEVVAVYEDITERMRREESLRESEARLRLSVAAANVGLWDWDLRTNTVYFSPEWKRQIGYRDDEIYNQFDEWHSRVHPDDLELTLEKVRAFTGDPHGPHQVEFRFRHKDGSYRWIYTQADVLRDEEDRPVRMLGCHVDITERKQTEEALRASEQRFRELADMLPGVVFEADRDLNLTYVNRDALEVFGYSRQEFEQGLNGLEMIIPEDRNRATENLAKRVRGEKSGPSEYTAMTKDERTFPILLYPSPIMQGRECVGMRGIIVDISERKRAEEALQDSNSRYRAFFDYGPDGVVILEPETGRIVEFNDRACHQLGYSREEFGRLRVADIEAVETPEETIAHIQRIVRMGHDDFETRQRTKQGEIRDIHVTAQVIQAGGRNVYHCVWRDITERKRAEQALGASEERFRSIVRSSPMGMHQYELQDDRLVLTGANPAAERILGVEHSQLIGKTIEHAFPGLIGTEVPDRYRDAARHGTTWRTEHIDYEEGMIRGAFEVVAFQIAPGKMVALFNEITDRKRAEAERFEALSRFSGFAEASQYGMGMAELDGRIVYANPTLIRMLGETSPDNCLGKHFPTAYYSPSLTRKLQEEVLPVLMQGGHWQGELELLTVDGRRVPTEENYFVIRDEQDQPRYLADILTDITTRKRAEAEQERLQLQLTQAQKMESIGRLAGGVAHDFNNMLGVILGHAELALEQVSPDQPLHSDLQEIQKAAQRSAELTRQLLAFARRQTVTPRVLNLNDTVEGMLKMLHRLIGEDIDLAWMPKADLWGVKMDPAQVDQVLANLCVNARDAIKGVGKVTIETENTHFDEAYCAEHAGFVVGDYVQLAVSDSGCGMGKDVLDHLFEPFFTTKGAGEGTGLGLATVYGIVKQNEGFVNVYSEPGQGTTFKIYLPRYLGEAEAVRAKGDTEAAPGGHETVLLVEDEPAILKIGRRMLEGLGYTVLCASTPGEALALAEKYAGGIHLLITDVVMPEMNGRELSSRLLTLYPDMKRLFVSGYTANVIAHHGVLDKGVAFLQKPFSLKSLAAEVREVLDSQ